MQRRDVCVIDDTEMREQVEVMQAAQDSADVARNGEGKINR